MEVGVDGLSDVAEERVGWGGGEGGCCSASVLLS